MSRDLPDEDDQRTGTSRRTVVRSLVWTAPVITAVSAAPAFAASCTMEYPSSSQTYSRTSNSAADGTITFTNGRTTTVMFRSAFTRYQPTADVNGNANLALRARVGGTGQPGITLSQRPDVRTDSPRTYYTDNRNDKQLLTITFDPPVRDFSFKLTDIDSDRGDFIDAVEITGSSTAGATPFSATPSSGSTVKGAGTQTSPLEPTGTNTPSDNDTGVGGNVDVSFTGVVDTVTIRYWNRIGQSDVGNGVDPDQAMYLTGLAASIRNSGCPD